MRAAAADIERVPAGLHGEAEVVHGVRVGGDHRVKPGGRLGGEPGLESVGGVEGDVGGDRVFVAGGAVVEGVGGGREVGEGFGGVHWCVCPRG